MRGDPPLYTVCPRILDPIYIVTYFTKWASWTYSSIERRDTICPRSSDSFYIVAYYIKWVTTSWIYSMKMYYYAFIL